MALKNYYVVSEVWFLPSSLVLFLLVPLNLTLNYLPFSKHDVLFHTSLCSYCSLCLESRLHPSKPSSNLTSPLKPSFIQHTTSYNNIYECLLWVPSGLYLSPHKNPLVPFYRCGN